MGIKIVPTLSEEEKQEKARRESLMSRLKGLSSEQLESIIERIDKREASEMSVDTPSKTMASGGLVGGQKKLDKNKDGNISGDDFAMMRKNYAYGGRVAKMSAEKS